MHWLIGKIVKLLLNKKEPRPKEYVEPICICVLGVGARRCLEIKSVRGRGEEDGEVAWSPFWTEIREGFFFLLHVHHLHNFLI